MNKPPRYANSPAPAFHRDLDAAHHRAIAVKHEHYHRKLAARRKLVLDFIIFLAALAVLVMLVPELWDAIGAFLEAFRP